jgi:hypothetical protein
MTKNLKFTMGVKAPDGSIIKELPIYKGGAEVEKVYTSDKSTSSLYSWFADVISASISHCNGESIAENFLEGVAKGKKIHPALVLDIPLPEVGNLMLQIQRECWQDTVKNQDTICKWCGDAVTIPEIELNLIEIPEIKVFHDFIPVNIGEQIVDVTGIDIMKDYNGRKYNTLYFRTPTLRDAIRHEKVAADDVVFWRNIAFDTLTQITFEEIVQDGEESKQVKESLDAQYITLRSKQIFTKDLGTKALKAVREALQNFIPSAKMYYEDDCPCPKKRKMPYFVVPGDFFS